MKKPTKSQPSEGRHVVLQNRRARHEYSIVDTVEAGLVLVGTEVKSLRNGKANLTDAFAKIEDGEAWLYEMHIAPYEHGSRWNPDPRRRRKLLLHRKEIDRLRGLVDRKGYTLVPLSIYFKRGYAKVELALAHGKRLYDKRESIAKRDLEREVAREVRGRRPGENG